MIVGYFLFINGLVVNEVVVEVIVADRLRRVVAVIASVDKFHCLGDIVVAGWKRPCTPDFHWN